MQTWQYMLYTVGREMAEDVADAQGEAGWEMVSVAFCPNEGGLLMVFKRPLLLPTPSPEPSAWTKQPQGEGYYFARADPNSKSWRMVDIEMVNGRLQGRFASGGLFRIDEMPSYEWQGPLTPKP